MVASKYLFRYYLLPVNNRIKQYGEDARSVGINEALKKSQPQTCYQ